MNIHFKYFIYIGMLLHAVFSYKFAMDKRVIIVHEQTLGNRAAQEMTPRCLSMALLGTFMYKPTLIEFKIHFSGHNYVKLSYFFLNL